MKKFNKYLSLYNTIHTLVVVSIYPPKSKIHGKKVGGVASFTKNTIINFDRPIVVIADVINKPEVYQEDGMLIVRCWKRNSIGLYWQILNILLKLNRTKIVLWQFEFAMYGEIIVTGILPIFMMFVKLLGKKNIVLIHQVILNLANLSGHIGLGKDSVLLNIFSIMLRQYYKLLSSQCSKIIVLERHFKARLGHLILKKEKIIAIPHGVNTEIEMLSKSQAKHSLGLKDNDFVVLIFGFITWYKGTDLALDAVSTMQNTQGKENIKLILAGGKSPTQQSKAHYQKYYGNITKKVSETKNVFLTDYVAEEDFSRYFCAADVVLLPYRSFMSSSGILSLALSYGSAIALSTPLKKWFSKNSKEAEHVPFFEPSVEAVFSCLVDLSQDYSRLEAAKNAVENLRTQRDYKKLAASYEQVFGQMEVEELIVPARAI